MNDIPIIRCPACKVGLKTIRSISERGKVSLSLICEVDGRHFRTFIDDQSYVKQVLARLEGQTPSPNGGDEVDANPSADTRCKTNLERDNG